MLKTSELTGAALDWAVAEAGGVPIYRRGVTMTRMDMDGQHYWQPTTDWAQGGPIIERERIDLDTCGNEWRAVSETTFQSNKPRYYGPTPLIAAMRCYVASKLGDEVDVPLDLLIYETNEEE